MKTLLISPHLDDAALSCATRLQGGEVTEVVTVFAGVPGSEEPLSEWDVLTKAPNARQRAIERLAEDASAWASIAQSFRHWNYVEAHTTGIDKAAMSREIGDLAGLFQCVLVPAGIGRHPHHVMVRDAALAALPRNLRIILYGELPYAGFFGWPTFDAHLDVEAQWRSDLAGVAPSRLSPPRLNALGAKQLAWKKELLAHYPSQMAAVSGGSLALFTTTNLLNYEVEFDLD